MLYPAFGELIDYCDGFMFADLPWFNKVFASSLTDPLDSTPAPYLLFYANLNIASTFLLPIMFIILAFIVLGLISYFKKSSKETALNIALVVYNYFLGGLSFAAVACIQGAFLNPMTSHFTISSGLYLFGIFIFVLVLLEAVWSTSKDT